MPSIQAIICCAFTFIELATGTYLLNEYHSDYTLSLSNSPYYVNTNVTFKATTTVTIENGVEIIFNLNRRLTIEGNINCGCNNIDTTGVKQRGLADPSQFVNIVGYKDSYGNRFGAIDIANTNLFFSNQINFCNTKFSNLYAAIRIRTPQHTNALIDNCLFVNNWYGTYFDATDVDNSRFLTYITDSIMSYNDYINWRGHVIYENNDINHYNQFVIFKGAIRNNKISQINNHWLDDCIKFLSYVGDALYAIYNNTISDCENGIEFDLEPIQQSLYVQNNEFTNITSHVLQLYDIGQAHLHINNNKFINNANLLNGVNYDLNKAHNITMQNNEFINNTASMLLYSRQKADNSYFTFKHNLFDSNIAYWLSNIVGSYYFDVSNNTFRNNKLESICFRTRNSLSFSHNSFVQNDDAFTIIDIYGNTVNIEGNIFHNSAIYNYFTRFNGQINIKYNSFYSDVIGDYYVYTYSNKSIVQYNNFYNSNNVNSFIVNGWHSRRYWKIVNATNNYFDSLSSFREISHMIDTRCWRVTDGVVKWIPFYNQPIDFKNIITLPEECSEIYLNTSNFGCYNYIDGYCPHTLTPTNSPITSTPTMNPSTSNPTTLAPSTSYPTTSNPTTSAPSTSYPITSYPTASTDTTSYLETTVVTASSPGKLEISMVFAIICIMTCII